MKNGTPSSSSFMANRTVRKAFLRKRSDTLSHLDWNWMLISKYNPNLKKWIRARKIRPSLTQFDKNRKRSQRTDQNLYFCRFWGTGMFWTFKLFSWQWKFFGTFYWSMRKTIRPPQTISKTYPRITPPNICSLSSSSAWVQFQIQTNVRPKINIEGLWIYFFGGISSRDVECTRSRILSYFKTTQKQPFITTSSWPTQNTLLRLGIARMDLECPEAGP